VRLPEGERLDEAVDLFHNDSWRDVNKPVLSVEQVAYLLTVWEPWYRELFLAPRSQYRPKQKVQNRSKPKVDKGSQSLGRKLVYARSGGRCEAGCGSQAHEWHHRKARSLGGTWHASNGMHLCRYCHAWVGEHAIEAGSNGWYLGANENPSAVPMLRFGVRVYVDDEGGWTAVEGEVA
jgi:hypothetical protein